MNKTLRIFTYFIIMIVSIIPIILTISYEKKNIDNHEIVLFDESENNTFNKNNVQLSKVEIVIISISVVIFVSMLFSLLCSLFPFLCQFNKFYYYIIYILIGISFSLLLIWVIIILINKYFLVSKNIDSSNQHYQSYIVRPVGDVELDRSMTLSYKKYFSKSKDTNVILVKSDTSVNLEHLNVSKRGNSSNVLSAKIYGTNAGVLGLKDSVINLNNSTIDTYATGAIGLFATLENAIINVDMTNIETTGVGSTGIAASFNSRINASNVKVKTSLSSSPAISSIKYSIINVSSSILETNAGDSPLIQTSSEVNLDGTNGDANASGIALIEDMGIAKISNCYLKAAGIKNLNDSDNAGIIFRRNILNNNYKDSANINVYKSTIEIKRQSRVYDKAPMFLVQNNNTIVNIEDSNFLYGSNKFLVTMNLDSAKSNKTMKVILNARDQKIIGDIITDQGTSLELNFNNTSFEGTINKSNEMKKITLSLNDDSTLILTGDSYVSILNINSYQNIISNGYTLYYDKKLNNKLNGETITLEDGGKIKGI